MSRTLAEMERRIADLERRLARIARVGRVSSASSSAATARVRLDDDDDSVTHDLPVLQRRTKGARDYASLAPDEQVLCLFIPAADGGEVGFVLGCHYSEADAPPADDPDVRVVAGADLRLGSVDASHPYVLGDALRTYLRAHTHPTPNGPSGPPTQVFDDATAPGYPHLSETIKGE